MAADELRFDHASVCQRVMEYHINETSDLMALDKEGDSGAITGQTKP